MSLLRRNFVPDQGRKIDLSESKIPTCGAKGGFSDEELGQKAKQKGITYFLSVP